MREQQSLWHFCLARQGYWCSPNVNNAEPQLAICKSISILIYIYAWKHQYTHICYLIISIANILAWTMRFLGQILTHGNWSQAALTIFFCSWKRSPSNNALTDWHKAFLVPRSQLFAKYKVMWFLIALNLFIRDARALVKASCTLVQLCKDNTL